MYSRWCCDLTGLPPSLFGFARGILFLPSTQSPREGVRAVQEGQDGRGQGEAGGAEGRHRVRCEGAGEGGREADGKGRTENVQGPPGDGESRGGRQGDRTGLDGLFGLTDQRVEEVLV